MLFRSFMLEFSREDDLLGRKTPPKPEAEVKATTLALHTDWWIEEDCPEGFYELKPRWDELPFEVVGVWSELEGDMKRDQAHQDRAAEEYEPTSRGVEWWRQK